MRYNYTYDFIFDFIFFCPDEEKFAANARNNYDYTYTQFIIDFKEEKNINFSSRRRCRNFQKKKTIHTY